MVARDVGSSPALGTIFLIFITHMTLVVVTMILYKLCTLSLLNLPYACICKCKAISCMSRGTRVVVYTDLLGKGPHRQVGMGIVMTSRGAYVVEY